MSLPSSSNTGLAPNVAGALAYLLGPITGVTLLVIEKEDPFVRFHAAQSIVVGLAFVAASIATSIAAGVLAIFPIVGWLAAGLLGLLLAAGGLVLWLLLMWRAYQSEEWELPVLGQWARQMLD